MHGGGGGADDCAARCGHCGRPVVKAAAVPQFRWTVLLILILLISRNQQLKAPPMMPSLLNVLILFVLANLSFGDDYGRSSVDDIMLFVEK